jgi:hypothetical protein
MYPLDFPHGYLAAHGRSGDWVLDPFCGRGTTNFAARLCGMPSVGIDTSPIAAAIAQAKLAHTTPERLLQEFDQIAGSRRSIHEIPEGEFWEWAFEHGTLEQLCLIRSKLIQDCNSDERIVLRAIMLGALHGPRNKFRRSYLSNQCPRTFAPKPDYSVEFWKRKNFRPEPIDVRDVVELRAGWYLRTLPPKVLGSILRTDSRHAPQELAENTFRFVVTSPPYYGMKTYIPDQWLRSWFLGGPSQPCYQQPEEELHHNSPESFADGLAAVWKSIAPLCTKGARMVCRFGGINDRRQDPVEILFQSFNQSGWRVLTRRGAGDSLDGKRQAAQFGSRVSKPPRTEFDVYAMRI